MPGYRLTRLAEDDVVDIFVTGARNFGAARAESYYAGLLDIFDLIVGQPYLAPERPEFDPPVRLHRHEAHHIVYIVDDQGVLIVRVLSRRQAWARLIGPNE